MAAVVVQKNLRVTRRDEIVGRHDGDTPWAEVILEDGRNRVVWISGPAGNPPDPHIHPNFNEWWFVLDGMTRWQIGQYEPIDARWGDIVMAPAGFAHDIRPIEGQGAIRVGVTHPDSNHDIKGVPPCRLIPVETDLSEPNLIHTRFAELKAHYGETENWKHIVVLDQRNRALITHEIPGTVNRRMWHPDMHKWWVVLQGRIEWSIGDDETVEAGPGDVVMVRSEEEHEIRTIGDEPSVRLTVTAPDIVHHYTDEK
jgi:mannose-6-phosphate isomerase-like protein (cupin superfamily)